MSDTVAVRYDTHPDAADENQRLVEQVFAELDRERPAGVRYAVVRMADGKGFLHVAQGGSALTEQPAFREFQRGFQDRLDGQLRRAEGQLIGSYRFGGAVRPAAVDIAVGFVEAFGKRDLAAVSEVLAEDVVFQSPRVRITGAADVAAAIGEFAQSVTGVTVLDAFGDDERAVVVYDVQTGPFGTLRAVDRIVVRDGRIVSDELVFDTAALG